MPEHLSTDNHPGGMAGGKLLSVCIAGRNDNYGGNFLYRLEVTLNHLAKNVRDLNLPGLMEILVTDWNSDRKLGDVLTLSAEARQLVRFICVPPETAGLFNPAGTNFHCTLAANVAMRRAAGRFVMYMGGDIVFSRVSFKNLVDLLRGEIKVPIDINRTLMLITRKFIPWQFVSGEPDIEAIDDYLFHNAWSFHGERILPGLNTCMGAFIMERGMVHECRGVDESLGLWGWSDIELGLRINQKYPHAVLSHLGICCYEQDIRREARLQTTQERNPQAISKSFRLNTATWGMADRDLEVYTAAGHGRPEVPPTSGSLTRVNLLREMQRSPVKSLLVQSFGEKILENPSWPAIVLLAWYTLAFNPKFFVDYAFLSVISSVAVPFFNPCITIIGIDNFEDASSMETLASLMKFLEDTLSFEGRLHVLSGDTHTAFTRLAESVRLSDRYDLVHFIPGIFPDTYMDQLAYMLPRISNRGAVVITNSDRESLKKIGGYLGGHPDEFLYIKSLRHGVGVIVKDECPGQARVAGAGLEESTEEAYMESILSRRT